MPNPIDLVGGFYTDDSLPWSSQDTVNYLPVAAEVPGTRTPTKLVDAPGLRPFAAIGNIGGDPAAGAPIRGLHDVEGRLFAVSGSTLYEISQRGIAIPRGAIPGVDRVSMAHNQRGHGHELLVVNGSGGYVYNTGTDTFTVVTDPGFPGAGVADFLDGYLMQVEPFGRFLFHSDLADALGYNTLDRFEAETAPDRVVGMIVNHQEVWAFGERTIDVFGNAGTATGTFQNKGVSISKGCVAKWSPAIIDNGVAWLGDDRVVYHARGYDPVRISTRAIDVALSECSLADIRNAFSFVWADRGHSVYYLTVPNGQTFGYDFSTGLWHRRASWHPELDIGGRWRISDLVRSNGRWIGADYRAGRMYVLDWDYMLDGCDPLIRERVSPVSRADGRRFIVDSVELTYDTGGPESACVAFPQQPAGPTITGVAPDGIVGEVYAPFTYTVTAGDAPIVSVAVISGSVPPGLDFSGGTLSGGPPEVAGEFGFTVRATDANGLYHDHRDVIGITYASYVRWRRQTASSPHLVVSADGRWARSQGPLDAMKVRSDTWLTSGSHYWEGTSGFSHSTTSSYSRVAALVREDGVITEIGDLVQHTDETGGPGVAAGPLITDSPRVVVSSYPNLSDPSDRAFRIRNRAKKESGGWLWEIAFEDGPWQTMASGLPGDFGFSCVSRGAVGSLPEGNVRIAEMISEPQHFKYPVPEGYLPAAAAVLPYTAADAPQLAETYTHVGSSNPQIVPMPISVDPGDLLIVHLTYTTNGGTGALTPPAGWSGPAPTPGLGPNYSYVRVLWKIADGDESGADLSIPTGARVGPYVAVVRRYTAGSFTAPPSIAIAAPASPAGPPVAPTLVPTWGRDPATYIATFSGFEEQTFTSMPYPDHQQTAVNAHLNVADCQTFAEVEAETPALFGLSNPDVTAWGYTLIGIEPGVPA